GSQRRASHPRCSWACWRPRPIRVADRGREPPTWRVLLFRERSVWHSFSPRVWGMTWPVELPGAPVLARHVPVEVTAISGQSRDGRAMLCFVAAVTFKSLMSCPGGRRRQKEKVLHGFPGSRGLTVAGL